MYFTITHSEKCSHAFALLLCTVVWVYVTLLNRAELWRQSYDNMQCWSWKSLRTWIFCCAGSVLMGSVVHLDSVNASSPGTQIVKMALVHKVIVLVWLAPLSLLFHFFMLWQLYTLCNPCTHVARGRCSWWPPLSVSCHTWPYLRMKAHLWTCDRALWSSCHTWTGSVPPTCLPPQHRR